MSNRDIAIRLSLKDAEKVERGLRALGEDGQAALAKIERQSAPASKGLLALNAATGDLRSGVSTAAMRLGPMGSAMSALGPAGTIGAAGIGAVTIALLALMRASVRAAEEIATIGDEAQQAGTAVEAYQQLQYAAESYSVSQEALTDGLKELNLRADEFIETGKGSASEAFERLGYSQNDLQKKLGQTDEMFLDIIKRMEGLDEAAQIRVADEIFGGTGGEQFVRMVIAGEAAVRGLMNEAREAGYVIDASLIKSADETRDKMNRLSRLIDLQLNSALVSLAPIALEVAEAFADVAKWVAEVVDSFRELENQSTRRLEGRMAELQQYFSENPTLPKAGNIYTAGKRHDWLENDAELQRIQTELQRRAANRAAASTLSSGNTPRTPGGGDAETEAERIKKVTDALRFQREQLDRTEVGRKVYAELQKAGIDGSHREARAIAQMVIEIQAEELAQKNSAKAKQEIVSMANKAKTAQEAYTETLEKINVLLVEQKINEETASAARAEATRVFEDAERQRLDASTEAADGIKRALLDIREDSLDTASQWEDAVKSMNSSARDAFIGITTGAQSMSDSLGGILNDLQNRLMGAVYDRTLGVAFDGLIGSALDGVFGAFHAGGVIGGAAPMSRQVDPSVFAGAQRYHSGGNVSGLRSDEVPIIAQRGERVLTAAQQDNTASVIANLAALAARPASSAPTVVVNNNAARVANAGAQTSQSSGGGWNIEIMVEEIENRMGRRIARGGGLAPTFEGRYGLDPAYGARTRG